MGRRSSSSSQWLQRQASDPYVKQRQTDGYRSRAAFKLIELNQRDSFLRPGAKVIDLGAAPGGWTQVATAVAGGRGMVVAVDVLEMQAVKGAMFILGDCRESGVADQIRGALGNASADLVMSDMAPNLTGIQIRDEAQAEELAFTAFDLVKAHLRPGGAFVLKLFHFGGTDAFVKEISQAFKSVMRRKPESSRQKSREFYVVAKGYVL